MLKDEIFAIEKLQKIKPVLLNRAYVLANIIEDKYKLPAKVYVNGEHQIEFAVKGKKAIFISIQNASWLTYKVGKTKSSGVILFGRKFIYEILDLIL